ncbi:MAG: hydrogenase expression/formation protein HypE [Leptonema sp. (in: bacteria)]
MNSRIHISHGNGGKQTQELIQNTFLKYLNHKNFQSEDSAKIQIQNLNLAITTDAHVIKPIFFPGGDIGKLSITGTINDLSVVGAKPLFITASFIIEEGFSIKNLKKILESMKQELIHNQIEFIAGDTKVVSKGEVDEIFISTTGIGTLHKNSPSGLHSIKEKDKVILSGTMGDHGACIYLLRNQLDFNVEIQSDCNSINFVIQELLNSCRTVKIMRDPTRGGVGTILNEFVKNQKWGIEIWEDKIPIREEVRGLCEILGIEAFHLACEGRFVCILSEEETDQALAILRKFHISKEASVIGEITNRYPSRVILHTKTGGKRILDILSNEILPRIC